MTPVCRTFVLRWILRAVAKNIFFRTLQSLRSLLGTDAHVDGLIPLMAIGAYLGVWEEDVQSWILELKQPPNPPYKLQVKPEFIYTSITRAAHQPKVDAPAPLNPYQPASSITPNPQAYRAVSASGLNGQLKRVATFLGWQRSHSFYFSTLLYSSNKKILFQKAFDMLGPQGC